MGMVMAQEKEMHYHEDLSSLLYFGQLYMSRPFPIYKSLAANGKGRPLQRPLLAAPCGEGGGSGRSTSLT
jgi:hypothetical protein